MTGFRVRWTFLVPVLVQLAAGCGEPLSGTEPGSADAASASDAGAGADASVDSPDAGAQDGGERVGCQGPGGFPAVEPDGPLADLDEVRDQALLDALYDRVKEHTWLSYNDARRAMLNTTDGIDIHDAQVECIYTGRTVPAEGATSNNINVEHTWPKSDYTGGVFSAESDLHHLFPSDGGANLRRGSWPFGDTDCEQSGDCLWSVGGSSIAWSPDGGKIFEVRPERRGDIARAHFYFSVRYRARIDSAEEQTLRCWSWTDPPDALEHERNRRIEIIQKKRNPFVDRPDLAERISDF